MNILHMKYAVEVAKAGSLKKASENLLIAQPNISRSIKDLEAHLGITIFDRSTKGMTLTPEGEDFIKHASNILNQIENVEKLYTSKQSAKQSFSVCAPKSFYIAKAFAIFSKSLSKNQAEIFFKEADSQHTINNILNSNYKLGIIRYFKDYDKYFKQMLEEKDFVYELIAEFKYSLFVSKNSPLAQKEVITYDDLSGLIEASGFETYDFFNPFEKNTKKDNLSDLNRRIHISDGLSQLELLSENPETFMFSSPIPKTYLEHYNLTKKTCDFMNKTIKDVLIYRSGYSITPLDKKFITELCNAKRMHIDIP